MGDPWGPAQKAGPGLCVVRRIRCLVSRWWKVGAPPSSAVVQAQRHCAGLCVGNSRPGRDELSFVPLLAAAGSLGPGGFGHGMSNK